MNATIPTLSLAAALALTAGCRSTSGERPAPAGSSSAASSDASSARESTTAAGPSELAPDDIVLAHVDGTALTLSDAMGTFEDSHGGHSGLMRGEPAVRELAGRLVERQLFVAEALALGLEREEEVADAVEERRQMLAEKLYWTREVDQKAEVAPEEIEAYYAKTDVMLAVTLVETVEREHCEQLRARVLAGESIVDIAGSDSIHSSRNTGGLVPLVRRGDFAPELDAAVFALEQDKALTPVVATEEGFAFARLDQRTVNENRPPREVMLPQIETVLMDVARRERRQQVEQELRAAAGIEVDPTLTALDVVLDERRDGTVVVARSAGQELVLGELQGYLQLERLRAVPADVAAEAVAAVIREWTDRKAVRAAARELGLFEDPEIQPQVDAWRDDVLLAYLLAKYVYADLEIAQAEVQAYYEEHKSDEFSTPAQTRVAYLVVPTLEAAGSALARLAAGEDFGVLAREISTDATFAAHGGRIGWIKEGEILEAVEGPVFAAAVGDLVGPIETDDGFFVVHVLERRERTPLPYDRAVGRARRVVEGQKRAAAYGLWVGRLEERADVDFHEPGIQQAVAWLEAEGQRRDAEKAAALQTESPHAGPSPHGGTSMGPPPGAPVAPAESPATPAAGGGQEELP